MGILVIVTLMILAIIQIESEDSNNEEMHRKL